MGHGLGCGCGQWFCAVLDLGPLAVEGLPSYAVGENVLENRMTAEELGLEARV